MNDAFRFKIAIQTMKDNRKITIILTLLFMIMAVMYCGMYPAVKDYMGVFSESMGDIPISKVSAIIKALAMEEMNPQPEAQPQATPLATPPPATPDQGVDQQQTQTMTQPSG